MQKQSYEATRKQLKTQIFWSVFSLFFLILSLLLDDKPFWAHPLPLIVTFFLWLNLLISTMTFRRDFKPENEPHNLKLKLPK